MSTRKPCKTYMPAEDPRYCATCGWRLDQHLHKVVELRIAEAVAAERDGCAKIAEEMAFGLSATEDRERAEVCEGIALKIRARGGTKKTEDLTC